MPPSRGHELKLFDFLIMKYYVSWMPPSRGHELKLLEDLHTQIYNADAPFAGARVETQDLTTFPDCIS